MSNREQAFALRLEGLTYTEIGHRLNISRQRVQQLTSPPTYILRKVFEKADGKCEDCGIVARDLHVHHIQSNGVAIDLYNDLANLQLLCVSCHRRAHPIYPSGKPPFVRHTICIYI